ncbi:unnamed protein product, partial [marine sediment metagenome]
MILDENHGVIVKVANLEIIHSPLSFKTSKRLSNYLTTLKEYYMLKNGKIP